MTRPASRSSASRPETRSITEGVGLPAPSFFGERLKLNQKSSCLSGNMIRYFMHGNVGWSPAARKELRLCLILDSDRMDCPVLDVSRLPTRVDRFGLRPPNTTLNR